MAQICSRMKLHQERPSTNCTYLVSFWKKIIENCETGIHFAKKVRTEAYRYNDTMSNSRIINIGLQIRKKNTCNLLQKKQFRKMSCYWIQDRGAAQPSTSPMPRFGTSVCSPPLAYLHEFHCGIPELKPDWVFPAFFLPSHECDQINRGFSSTAGVEERKKS